MRNLSSLNVYFDRLDNNLELIKKYTPHGRILPMVKSQAYGVGLIPFVEHLKQHWCQGGDSDYWLEGVGVASLAEAVALRNHVPHFRKEIFVFSETCIGYPRYHNLYADLRLTPVIYDYEDLKIFLNVSDFQSVPLVLKFNVGMNRLGMTKDQWESCAKLIKASGRSSINHFMCHYSCSGDGQHLSNQATIQAAEDIRQNFLACGFSIDGFSLANSGAIENQKFSEHETHIRPGLMMYGPRTLADRSHPLMIQRKCISDFQTVILQASRYKAGDCIGYGAVELEKDCVVAIIGVGYGDGIFQCWSGVESSVIILDDHNSIKQVRWFGKVNMDMSFLLFDTAVDPKRLKGKKILLWNDDPSYLEHFSQQTALSTYEILCGISSRVPRYYDLK